MDDDFVFAMSLCSVGAWATAFQSFDGPGGAFFMAGVYTIAALGRWAWRWYQTASVRDEV